MLWVPHNIEELVKESAKLLDFPSGSCMLSEDGGKILDASMINDGQKLHLICEEH